MDIQVGDRVGFRCSFDGIVSNIVGTVIKGLSDYNTLHVRYLCGSDFLDQNYTSNGHGLIIHIPLSMIEMHEKAPGR